ncbi:MAG: Uma2 family endonuclease [Acidobacteria bacterium]|nr:Uma2 family endonuclease [Acidobacteriota bacterium]
MATNPIPRLTEEEYLRLERAAEYKSEYYQGEMFAMSGASFPHSRIQRNLLVEFSLSLRDNACEALGSDVRVRVAATGLFTYPDVVLVCDQPEFADDQKDTLLNPIVIIEVLSPSTETYDRGQKFRHYRTIPSLQHYILVDQTAMRVEHHRRQPDESWVVQYLDKPEDELRLDPMGVAIPLHLIYARVELAPEIIAAEGLIGLPRN